ncbi:MAG TPA: DUF6600 domain-containing protein [Rhizomicrobium sp.]|jgi:hypothetical protein|nr:DUF6600 domain-containing protein [Rhizomicrobium sp.]
MAVNRNMIVAAAAAGLVVAGAGGVYYWKNQHDIRSVDFRNGPVEIFGTACADPDLTSAAVTTIPLHDGAYQLGKYQFELVSDVKFGDVSGQTNQDAGEKAVFVGSCNTGGSTSQVLFVYGMQDGKLTRLATADLSNAGSSVVQSYSIGNGAIQIRENQGTPPQLVTISYALLGGQLQNVGGGNTPAPATQMAANTTTMPAAATTVSDDTDDTSGDDKVSFQYFHDQLSPYGEWVDHPRWGQVWRPKAESADYRPYRDGHWENNDEYGMTWVADNDAGDIVDHYGRWAYDPDPAYRWMWVPDYTWAPSWVVWRGGEGHVGWMPMPPNDYDGEGDYADDWANWYGYRNWYADMTDDEFYNLWSFVTVADLLAPSLGASFVEPAVYGRFIDRIPGWTHYGVFRGRVVDRSFEPRRFAAAFHRRLPVSHGHNIMHHHVPKTSAHGGLRIASHEHRAGHAPHLGVHVGGHIRGPSAMHGRGGVAMHGVGRHEMTTHSFRSSGVARSGVSMHRSGAFSRSGTGYAQSRSGSSRATGGYGRSGYGSGISRNGGFSRGGTTGSGFARSGNGGFGGQNGFARQGGSGFANNRNVGGGRSFGGGNAMGGGGRSFGGGNGLGGQRAATPHFNNAGGNGGGNNGGGNHHHGH